MTAAAERPSDESEFTNRLAFWQDVLTVGGAEAVTTYGVQLTNELDSLCEGLGEECDFMGQGMRPELRGGASPFEVETGHIESGKGLHNGMRILTTGDEPPRLWYEFIIFKGRQQLSAIENRDTTLFTYLDPATAVIRPHSSYAQAFQSDTIAESPLEDVPEILRHASRVFAVTLQSKAFLKLPREQQVSFVDNYTNRFDQQLALRDAGLVVNGTYFYSRRNRRAQLPLGEEITPFNGNYLKGTCLALGFLGSQALATDPIRRRSELFDKNAGLCLIVESAEIQPELSLATGDIAYVPISSQVLKLGITK